MGEIKSTLDLVMEKTKHLTLSQEEKQEQRLNEARPRIKGLIQKYQDRVLDEEKFAKELDSITDTYNLKADNILLNELLDDLHVDRDNEPHFALLKEICGIDITELVSICDGYNDEIRSMTEERIQALKNSLAERRSIAGSAVWPNVETDTIWQAQAIEINNKFDQLLGRAKAALTT